MAFEGRRFMFLRSMQVRRAGWAAALLVVLGSSRGAIGASPSPDPERAFLADAAAIGRAMVETGRLAAHRGGAPEIRAVGTPCRRTGRRGCAISNVSPPIAS
jgi:hypothetical protein